MPQGEKLNDFMPQGETKISSAHALFCFLEISNSVAVTWNVLPGLRPISEIREGGGWAARVVVALTFCVCRGICTSVAVTWNCACAIPGLRPSSRLGRPGASHKSQIVLKIVCRKGRVSNIL